MEIFIPVLIIAIIGLVSNVFILYNKEERLSAKSKIIGFVQTRFGK